MKASDRFIDSGLFDEAYAEKEQYYQGIMYKTVYLNLRTTWFKVCVVSKNEKVFSVHWYNGFDDQHTTEEVIDMLDEDLQTKLLFHLDLFNMESHNEM